MSDTDSPVGPPCPAMLMMHGEAYPCDWPTSALTGDHCGWAHSNETAQAIWTENKDLPDEEQGMQIIQSGQIGAVDLGTVTGEGLAPPAPATGNVEAGIQHDSPYVDPVAPEPAGPQEASLQIDSRLLWVLTKCAEEWGAETVATAAAFMAGGFIENGC